MWRAFRSTSEKTATVRIPISLQARSTRTAISPRFAIRILRNTFASYRGMLPCLRGGFVSRLFLSISNALMTFGLVSEGMITSSM